MYTCPVCYFGGLAEAPQEYNICDCCGTEFGSDDELRSHEQLRSEWTARGARWFFHDPPPLWNPWQQLANASAPLPYVTNVFYTSPHLAPPERLYHGLTPTTVGVGYGPAYFGYGGVPLISTSIGNSFAEPPSAKAVEGEFADDLIGMAA
jgi:hypothetical protein